MAIQAAFTEELAGLQDCNDCFLALFGQDSELDLASLNVKTLCPLRRPARTRFHSSGISVSFSPCPPWQETPRCRTSLSLVSPLQRPFFRLVRTKRNFSVPCVILQILLLKPRGILFRLNDREFRGGACGNSHAVRMKAPRQQGNFSSRTTHPKIRVPPIVKSSLRARRVPCDCTRTQQQISALMERKVFLDQSVGGGCAQYSSAPVARETGDIHSMTKPASKKYSEVDARARFDRAPNDTPVLR